MKILLDFRRDELLKGFETHLVLRGRGKRTVIEYLRDINQLLDYIQDTHRQLASESRELLKQIKSYLVYLKLERGLSNRALNRKISAIRGLLRYLYESELIDVDLSTHLHTLKIPKNLPKALTIDELQAVLQAIANSYKHPFLKARDQAMLALLYTSGIRVSELVRLNLSDIDLESRTLRVIGKGQKERMTLFNIATRDILENYLRERENYFESRGKPYDREALFLSLRGSRICVRSVQVVTRKLSRLVTLRFNLTPHKFRHTFATHMLELGADIVTIKELLGHANLNTTQIYTEVSKTHKLRAYKLDKVEL